MARFRLLAPAHIDGVMHAAGSILHKAHDWVGPHRTKVAHANTTGDGDAHGHDEPLYERLADEHDEAPAARHGVSPADATGLPTLEEIEKAKDTLRRAETERYAAMAVAVEAGLINL